jgi:anthranilate 1,2-dioxygenase large subunit/terephthalate 1,2-dioxygenase oxygenase component alpha subunit
VPEAKKGCDMKAIATDDLRKRVGWPGDGVHQVPYHIYTDPDIYAEEQTRIFRGKVWNFIGHEFEVPKTGDYVTRYMGDTPVVLVRDATEQIHVLVNRCAHRGNLVCHKARGNAEHLTCVYHNWIYDLNGDLSSIAFRRGIGGRGGMPEGFDMAQHGMQRLRCESYQGLIFATFSEDVSALADYLGPEMCQNIDRVAGRKMKLIGTHNQFMPNNWKLYMENVRDSYHASLLHMFQAAFGINRLTMDGGIKMSPEGWHHISYSMEETDSGGDEAYSGKNLHAMDHGFALADPSLVKKWREFDCGTTLAIQSIYPNFVCQQIYNSIALRLCLPKGPEECELVWWVLGTEDDTEEEHDMRVVQSNMIGPGGLISMEDGVIGGWVQRATKRDGEKTTVLEMGGHGIEPSENSRATEVSIRGFWAGYRSLMDV